jgi:DNA repair protein RadD
VGLTATPYRLDSGRLDDGRDALFDEVLYEASVSELIDAGYLSPLVSKRMVSEVNVSGLARRGGDYVASALEGAAMDVVAPAVAELCAYGSERRAWIVFAAGVKHAMQIRDEVRGHGHTCEAITGDMAAGQRDWFINEFRAGRIRCLTSVGVLTTGFNVPHVDLVGLMRPTLSAGLFVQQVGRGFRIAPGKTNCLVLDWAGLTRKFGPVDAIEVESRRPGSGAKMDPDAVRAKECPVCESLAALNARTCKDCGHEWPASVEHDTMADDAPILSREIVQAAPEPLRVHSWTAKRHAKPGAPPSVRVEYMAGMQVYREWLLFEHGGYPARKAGQWWRLHGGDLPVPTTTEEALVRWPSLTAPATITTRPSGKWFEIVGRTFESSQQEGEAA